MVLRVALARTSYTPFDARVLESRCGCQGRLHVTPSRILKGTERPVLASGRDPTLGSVAVATRWARDALSTLMSMARLNFLRLLLA